MRYCDFNGVSVSAIAFGSMALTYLYNPHSDLSEAYDALETALDAGVNTIHTAYHYGDGRAFQIIRRVLANRPSGKEVRFVTKIDGHPSKIISAKDGIDTTRYALDRDYIDFLQLVESSPEYIERVTPDDILRDLKEKGTIFETVQKLQEQGIVGQVGVEVYTPDQLRLCLQCSMLNFIVLDQSIIRQTAFEQDVVDGLITRKIRVFAIRPLAGGWLTRSYRSLADFAPGDNRAKWYWPGESYRKAVQEICHSESLDITEMAIRFLLGQRQINSIVLGMRKINHVREAILALEKGVLPKHLQEQLESLFDQPVILEPDCD